MGNEETNENAMSSEQCKVRIPGPIFLYLREHPFSGNTWEHLGTPGNT